MLVVLFGVFPAMFTGLLVGWIAGLLRHRSPLYRLVALAVPAFLTVACLGAATRSPADRPLVHPDAGRRVDPRALDARPCAGAFRAHDLANALPFRHEHIRRGQDPPHQPPKSKRLLAAN
jgi:hypothetical protein